MGARRAFACPTCWRLQSWPKTQVKCWTTRVTLPNDERGMSNLRTRPYKPWSRYVTTNTASAFLEDTPFSLVDVGRGAKI